MGKIIINEINGKYIFQIKAANGEIIAQSKSYISKHTCINGINSAIKSVAAANDKLLNLTGDCFKVITNPKFEIFKTNTNDYTFILRAKNGEALLYGGDYKSKLGCMNGIESVKRNTIEECEIVVPNRKQDNKP